MNRLTERNEDGTAYFKKCYEEPCYVWGCQNDECEYDIELVNALTAYEDTRLSLDRILQMDKEYRKNENRLRSVKKMRLIDADEENGKLLDFIAEHDNAIQYALEHKDMTMLEDIFFEYFEAQKTAYDVDKVVEQLHKIQVYRFQGKRSDGRICHFSDAIEIVKAGGEN